MVGRDTLVQGPRREFVLFAANFDVCLQNARLYARSLNKYIKTVEELRDQNLSLKGSNEAILMINDQMSTRCGLQQDELIACASKRDRLKPWATIGKITVVVVMVAVIAGMVVVVYRNVSPI